MEDDIYDAIHKNRRVFDVSLRSLRVILGDRARLIPEGSLWIPQGIASPHAAVGINELMDEMLDFIAGQKPGSPWKVHS